MCVYVLWYTDWLLFIADFNLTDELKFAIDEAKRKYEAATSNFDVDYIIYDKIGKDYLKLNKLGPDSFMQLAFQVSCNHYSNQQQCQQSCFSVGIWMSLGLGLP